jgi:recombination protein RecT
MPDKKETALAVRPIEKMSFPEMLSDKRVMTQIARVLPKKMDAVKMAQVAMTVFRKSDALQKCSPASILSSLIECAQLGLETDRTLGHAYLVPFKGECTMIAGYKGYIALAMRTGQVSAVWAEVVREADTFQILSGTLHQIHHTPVYPQSPDEKKWIGVYACIRYKDGYVDFEYVDTPKVHAIRARSSSWKAHVDKGYSSPWKTDPEWMFKKTAVRQLFHRVELSPEDSRLQRLAIRDDLKESGLASRAPGEFGVDAWQPREEKTLEGPRELTEAKELGDENGTTQEPAQNGGDATASSRTTEQAKSDAGGGTQSKAQAKKPEPAKKADRISEAQRIELYRLMTKHETDDDKMRALWQQILKPYGFAKTSEITVDVLAEITEKVKGLKK